MITSSDIAALLDPRTREFVDRNLTAQPVQAALSLGSHAEPSLRAHAALIATQIKYLQRARTKLPSYYRAQCIVPPLAFEQCSSEEAAAMKRYAGRTCIDLTCGLGVDSLHFSRHFERVIAIERDPGLSEIARINFRLLGIENITVVNASAEEFLEGLESGDLRRAGLDERDKPLLDTIDLIYLDPARRDAAGKKVWLLEDCSPDAVQLMPRMLAHTRQVVIKTSPLFDVDEAFRLFGTSGPTEAAVEVVSVHGECKEVLIEVSRQGTHPGSGGQRIRVTAPGYGSLEIDRKTGLWQDETTCKTLLDTTLRPAGETASATATTSAPATASATGSASASPGLSSPESGAPKFLLIPDVGLYKARLVAAYATRTGCTATSATGYCLGERIPENFFGRAFPIREILPYRPKAVKQRFKQLGITRCNILKKDFPEEADTIAKALGIAQGGTDYAAATRIAGQRTLLLLGPEIVSPANLTPHG